MRRKKRNQPKINGKNYKGDKHLWLSLVHLNVKLPKSKHHKFKLTCTKELDDQASYYGVIAKKREEAEKIIERLFPKHPYCVFDIFNYYDWEKPFQKIVSRDDFPRRKRKKKKNIQKNSPFME